MPLPACSQPNPEPLRRHKGARPAQTNAVDTLYHKGKDDNYLKKRDERHLGPEARLGHSIKKKGIYPLPVPSRANLTVCFGGDSDGGNPRAIAPSVGVSSLRSPFSINSTNMFSARDRA